MYSFKRVMEEIEKKEKTGTCIDAIIIRILHVYDCHSLSDMWQTMMKKKFMTVSFLFRG